MYLVTVTDYCILLISLEYKKSHVNAQDTDSINIAAKVYKYETDGSLSDTLVVL